MVVVDTNVLSELMKPLPASEVVGWMNAWPVSQLNTTTITMAEVLYGIEILPAGKRRNDMQQRLEIMFQGKFAGRILTFDIPAARAFAEISARRRTMGRPILEIDAQIAAIARSRGASVATRNIRDFEDCGVALIDPWI